MCAWIVTASPAALSLCPCLTLLHPSGRRHPDYVNKDDVNRLYWRSGPTSERMRLSWGEEREKKDSGVFFKEKTEIQLDHRCKKNSQHLWLGFFFFQKWNTFLVINLQGDFVFKLLSAAVVFSKQCQCGTPLINRLLLNSFRSRHFAFRITLPYKVLSVSS